MKIITSFFVCLFTLASHTQRPQYDQTRDGFIVFHPVKVDSAGAIIPWYSDDPGTAYDFVINTTWNFWDTMRRDVNGLPYYMNHQVWRPINDPRGAGGDQYAMALSSWQLLYAYSGNEKVKDNMKFIADYYLSHGLSPANAKWPNIPYPYNTLQYSGIYDGDMIIGKGYTQPDKCGSFGWELIKLYKITGNDVYLHHAILIANTLAKQTAAGDANHSPMPFKVNAVTGEVGQLHSNDAARKLAGLSSYTTNWVGTLELWLALGQMKQGNSSDYRMAFDKILSWMKKYPLKNNRWGPFFEDIPGWSDTQINGVTFARFMMEHREFFPNWKRDVRGILDWVYNKLGNDQWKQYHVKAVNEQTVYQTPGNSHTARQAAAELQYAALTGDTTNKQMAIRQLNWATYMVDNDGKNNYPRDEVWLTDGYGDYIRHYLRSMAEYPELAPNDDHIVFSTSVIAQADYPGRFGKPIIIDKSGDSVVIVYRTYDTASTENIRVMRKPKRVTINDRILQEISAQSKQEGWSWKSFGNGGVLTIQHHSGNEVTIFK